MKTGAGVSSTGGRTRIGLLDDDELHGGLGGGSIGSGVGHIHSPPQPSYNAIGEPCRRYWIKYSVIPKIVKGLIQRRHLHLRDAAFPFLLRRILAVWHRWRMDLQRLQGQIHALPPTPSTGLARHGPWSGHSKLSKWPSNPRSYAKSASRRA